MKRFYLIGIALLGFAIGEIDACGGSEGMGMGMTRRRARVMMRRGGGGYGMMMGSSYSMMSGSMMYSTPMMSSWSAAPTTYVRVEEVVPAPTTVIRTQRTMTMQPQMMIQPQMMQMAPVMSGGCESCSPTMRPMMKVSADCGCPTGQCELGCTDCPNGQCVSDLVRTVNLENAIKDLVARAANPIGDLIQLASTDITNQKTNDLVAASADDLVQAILTEQLIAAVSADQPVTLASAK